jgi:exonuclease SbcD
MPKVKFIHTADLHLDTPFKGLAGCNSELAAHLKDATFKSFQTIVDLCISEQVDFLLIAGDIFDSDQSSLAAQLKFIYEMHRLQGNDIAVYIVCGNHDPLSSWIDTFQLPENVHRFPSDKVEIKTHKKGDSDAAEIHGISFQNSIVTDNLTKKYKTAGKPAAISIALLHGTIGTRGSHENYAPFKLDDILHKDFDYWALGHIHKPQLVQEAHPAVVYPGNPQGRDFGETGARGCYLVSIESGHTPMMTFIPTQQIRFEEVTIDISNTDQLLSISEKINNHNLILEKEHFKSNLIMRITLTGRTDLHRQLTKAGEIDQLITLFNDGQLNRDYFTWIDQIVLKCRPDIDIDRLQKRSDFPAEILNKIDKIAFDRELLHKLIEQEEKDMLTPQIKKEISALSVSEEDTIIENAKWLLLEHLIKE